MSRQPRFSQLSNNLEEIQKNILGFRVEFFDETRFKRFANEDIGRLFQSFDEVCITGYFSDGFAKNIIKNLKGLSTRVRIITQEHNVKRANDRKNLASLRKIQDAEVEIMVNHRTHFRMFLCKGEKQGLLVLGSFDFNKEGMNEERRDAGIYTTHPDLVESAYEYFNIIWDDEHDSTPLDEKYPDPKNRKRNTSRRPFRDEPPVTLPEEMANEIKSTSKRIFRASKKQKKEFFVAGTGLTSGTEVEVYLDQVVNQIPLHIFKVHPNGSWAGLVKLPPSTVTGTHHLWMKDKATGQVERAEIRVG